MTTIYFMMSYLKSAQILRDLILNYFQLTILNDHKNGGIKLHDFDPSKFVIASIPIGTSRTVRFALVNNNPVDVAMEKLLSIPANSIVQISEMRAANGTVINLFEKSFSLNSKMPLVTTIRRLLSIIHVHSFFLSFKKISSSQYHPDFKRLSL